MIFENEIYVLIHCADHYKSKKFKKLPKAQRTQRLSAFFPPPHPHTPLPQNILSPPSLLSADGDFQDQDCSKAWQDRDGMFFVKKN